MKFLVEEFLEELKTFVNIDCGTYNLKGIDYVAREFEKRYIELGKWTIKRVDCGKAGFALEIRNKPEEKDIDILILGHMDTVFGEGVSKERPLINDETKAYGPGVADMKSGLLVALYALRNVDEKVIDNLSICICMNVDEEKGSIDSVEWLQSVAKDAKQILVVEPGRVDGSFVSARKGNVRYKIEFHGKAAHSGNNPEAGISSIVEMSKWVSDIDSMNNFDKGFNVNIGTASGGVGANTIPAFAECIVEARFWDNIDFNNFNDRLKSMQEKPFKEGMKINIERLSYKPAMKPSKETEKFMRTMETIGSEIGFDVKWKEVGGGSDANNVSIFEVATVDGFGPCGDFLHSDKEYIILDSIEPRIKLMMRTIEKISADK